MSDLNIFAQRLKESREQKGWTQKQLSEKAELTPTTLSAYEKGLKNPSLTSAVRIARELEVSLDWLSGISEKQEQSISNYGDLIKLLVDISRKIEMSFKFETSSNFIEEQREYAIIILEDSTLRYPLYEWSKLKTLFEAGTIHNLIHQR